MSFPKNYSNVTNEIGKIRRFVCESNKEYCLIVGNGPSAAECSFTDSQLEKAFIIRCNWFFLENEPIYGRRVDAFFYSVHNEGLENGLKKVIQERSYKINSIFRPFHMNDDLGLDQSATPIPMFDHWAFFSQDPTIARFFMGRPLPTQGMQAIAFAALLGFREVFVQGLDMYQTKERYPWSVPKEYHRFLKEKDVAAGYEDNHSFDLDMFFLRTIKEKFDFKIFGSIGPCVFESLQDSSLSENNIEGNKNPSSIKQCAFITFATHDYSVGVIALARSLAKFSDLSLIVLYTDDATRLDLSHIPTIEMRKVSSIANPLHHGEKRFLNTYTKLKIFEQLDYKRLVYLDSDTMVLNTLDHLFDSDEILVAPDWGSSLKEGEFNSGMIAFNPSEELRDLVFSKLTVLRSDDGGDQGYLNQILKDRVKYVSFEYNTLKRLFVFHPNLTNIQDTKLLHFVGGKPWDLENFQPEYQRLETLWTNVLEAEDWRILFWEAKKKFGKPEPVVNYRFKQYMYAVFRLISNREMSIKQKLVRVKVRLFKDVKYLFTKLSSRT